MFAIELRQELIATNEPADAWAEASCRDESGGLTELFFSDQIPDIVRAKRICSTCSLITPCLQGALERREPWGVWGGELFLNGKVLSQKRRRGRPRKNPRPEDDIQLTA
jgi:WhiB family transcriptional regulator, redox-sensing transcriptional regulator